MTAVPETAEPPSGAARVGLHPLAVRPDGAEWIVGRFATREFVALPEVGVRALELLREGRTVGAVEAVLGEEFGQEVDVPGFVRELVGLGFVAELDGRPVTGPDPAPPSLPRLRPGHVRFTLSPVVPVLLGCLLAAAAAVLVRRPELLPSYRALVWSPHGSLVLGWSFATAWLLVAVHELAHLAAARATGVPARITLGTRLQFLVAQTDISGIELAPRRHRLTAYLAGIGVELGIVAALVPVLAATDPSGTPHRLTAAVFLLTLLSLPYQLMVFMRTDVYFVLQDLTRCRDLFGDGRAYARYVLRRLVRRAGAADDPSLELPGHERRAVRVYSVLLVVGSALCLGAMAAFTLPADVTMLTRAAAGLVPGRSVAGYADSVVVLVVLGGVHLLWVVTWWRARARRRG